MSATILTPSERLALSRERIRLAIAHNTTQAPPPLAALISGNSSLIDILKMALPGGNDVVDAVAVWWKEASLRPLAQRHPVALVAGALAVGALLAWTRPWRWLFRPALVTTLGPALITSVLASGTVQAWILEILQRKPTPPSTPDEPSVANAQSAT